MFSFSAKSRETLRSLGLNLKSTIVGMCGIFSNHKMIWYDQTRPNSIWEECNIDQGFVSSKLVLKKNF